VIKRRQILIKHELNTLARNITISNTSFGDRSYIYRHLAFELPNKTPMAIKDWIAL
jgi:hypothetical protein